MEGFPDHFLVYVIKYVDRVFWASKLQTQIALNSCKAEYISLSQSVCDTISAMRNSEYTKPKVHCKVFEDNTGALALAMMPK